MKTLRRFILFVLSITAGLLPAMGHPDTFKPEFTASLLPAYFKVQTALAADDLPAAKTAAHDLLIAIEKGPAFEKLSLPTKVIVSAEDLTAARAGFLKTSEEVIGLLDHVGTTGAPTVYAAHCPMAFSGKGGDWLQADKTVANPYFGSAMLRCGSVKPASIKDR